MVSELQIDLTVLARRQPRTSVLADTDRRKKNRERTKPSPNILSMRWNRITGKRLSNNASALLREAALPFEMIAPLPRAVVVHNHRLVFDTIMASVSDSVQKWKSNG